VLADVAGKSVPGACRSFWLALPTGLLEASEFCVSEAGGSVEAAFNESRDFETVLVNYVKGKDKRKTKKH